MHFIQKRLLDSIDRYQQRGGGLEQFRVDCNFTPRCSDYAKQAIAHYGVLKGCQLALARICRCRDRDQVGRIYDPLVREKQPGV